MEVEKTFASKLGRFIGNVFAVCMTSCIVAVAVALTVRFITWLF